MKRKIYARLLEWKEKDNGSCALLLDGARRVGKSYNAEWFAQNEYKSYLLIDFAHLPEEVKNIFENDINDFDLFFNKLSAYYRKALYKRESLIIFDEVQRYPKARELINNSSADLYDNVFINITDSIRCGRQEKSLLDTQNDK